MSVFKQLRRSWKSEFLSPKDFLVWAAALTVLFLIAHVAGLREYTSVLNGTIGSTEMSWEKSAMLGISYILLHLAFVVVVPILLLASAISVTLKKLFSKPSTDESGTDTAPAN